MIPVCCFLPSSSWPPGLLASELQVRMRCRETAVYDALAYFQLTLLCLRPSSGQEEPLSTLPGGPSPTSFKFVFSTLLFYRGTGVSGILLDSTHTQVVCRQGFISLPLRNSSTQRSMGGTGRFANHSCDSNCYVAKWT